MCVSTKPAPASAPSPAPATVTSTTVTRQRAPKPSQRLDPEAVRVLRLYLARGHDLEVLVSLSRSSESTVRRLIAGATGSRPAASMLALAAVVAIQRADAELYAMERQALEHLSTTHTPGSVGLAVEGLRGGTAGEGVSGA